MAVEALTRGIINKIMHTPITTLKSAARDPESTTVVDVVRKLFNLHAEAQQETTPRRRSTDLGTVPDQAAAAQPAPPLVANQSRK
jgi:hypothetical protein